MRPLATMRHRISSAEGLIRSLKGSEGGRPTLGPRVVIVPNFTYEVSAES